MSSKYKKGGIDGMLLAEPKRVGRPKSMQTRTIIKSSQVGVMLGETRATFIVNEDHLEQLKALAYFNRTSIKKLLNAALSDFFEKNKKNIGEALKLYEKNKKQE